MNSKVYKWCADPFCKNTSIATPNKLFVYVPNKKLVRDKWLSLARRDPSAVVTNSPLYFCEDHFDLPNDMENYMQYHLMGSVSQVRMKPGCIPKKFACQPETIDEPFKHKKRNMIATEKYELQLKESKETEHHNSEEIVLGSSERVTLKMDVEVKVEKVEVKIEYDHQENEDDLIHTRHEKEGDLAENNTLNQEYDCKHATTWNEDVHIKKEPKAESSINASESFTHEDPRHRLSPEHRESPTKPHTHSESDTGQELPLNLKLPRKEELANQVLQVEVELGKEPLTFIHSDNPKDFYCKECNRKFKSQRGFTTHQKLIHKLIKTNECKFCHKVLGNKNSLVVHLRLHNDKKYECDYCGLRTTQKHSLIPHFMIHSAERPFCCTVCGKSFNNRSTLTGHMRVHTQERPFKCEFCSKTFNQSSSLTKHWRLHTGEKPYNCELCQKRFRHLNTLVRHSRAHANIKPYKCKLCDKRFYDNTGMVRHLQTHTDDRPFPCAVCDRRFRDANKLKIHSVVHNKMKPYQCSICQKFFSFSASLNRHVKLHSLVKSFQCHACDRAFGTDRGLERHQRKHMVVNYDCKVCGKTFNKQWRLDKHSRSHVNEGRHECHYCGRVFKTKCNIASHVVSCGKKNSQPEFVAIKVERETE